MRIIVLSDTHGRRSLVRATLEKAGRFDVLLYAGDGCDDVADIQNATVYCVRGNCDYNTQHPKERVLELGGMRILLVHGHKYHVKSGLYTLYYRAQEVNADYVVFGHTHQSLITQLGGVTFINPGSLVFASQDGKRYYAYIDTSMKPCSGLISV
ncbi:MAG: metallophosphoesterase [Christensenellales bacterium]|jgi:putative phosphoesterase